MNRKICAIVAAGVVCMTLVACSKDKAEEGKILVSDKTADCTFQCPDSWEVIEKKGMLHVINPEDKTKANVTAFSFEHSLDGAQLPSAKEYWENIYVKQYASTFNSPENVKLSDTTLSSVPAVKATYTVKAGEEKFNCETVLCLYGDKVYTLTMTQGAKNESNKEGYNNHSDELEEIRKTFRIVG